MDYILAAEVENNNSIEEQSHNDRSRTWQRWVSWLESVGWHNDPFLTRLSRAQKARMVGAFAIAIRRGEFSSSRHTDPLVAGTVSKALSNLAATFQNNNHDDPRKTNDNKTDKFIRGILRAFKKVDPKEKAQKAATPHLLQHLYTRSKTEFNTHIADLCNGAFFFSYSSLPHQ